MIPISSVTPSPIQPPSAAPVPEAAARAPEEEPRSAPRRPSRDAYVPENRAGTCHADTDQADREIERLKEQRKALQRRLQSGPDPAEAQKLEQELARIESELRRKDNGAYRRQHTVFS